MDSEEEQIRSDFENGRRLDDDTSVLDLHNYSALPLCAIFGNVSLTDIVELSFVSSETRTAIRRSGRKIHEFRIRYEHRKPCVSFRSGQQWFHWNLYMPRDDGEGSVREEEVVVRKIGHTMFYCIRNAHGVFCTHHGLEDAFSKLFGYLVNLFDCAHAVVSELRIDLNRLDSIHSTLDHFKYYNIRVLSVRRSDVTPVSQLEARLNELRFDTFHLGFDVKRVRWNEMDVQRFRNTILSVPHIVLENCKWLDASEIAHFQSKTIMIGRPNNFSLEAIQELVKSWINGEHADLMWINIKMNTHWRLKEIVRGIPTEPLEFAFQHCNCPHRVIYEMERPFHFLPDSVQVTRADGTKATVCTSRSQFFFHVSDDATSSRPTSKSPIDELERKDILSRYRRLVAEHKERGRSEADMKISSGMPTVLKMELLERREEARANPETEAPKIRAEIRRIDRRNAMHREREPEMRRHIVETASHALDHTGPHLEEVMKEARAECYEQLATIDRFIMFEESANETKHALQAILSDLDLPLTSDDDTVVEDGDEAMEVSPELTDHEENRWRVLSVLQRREPVFMPGSPDWTDMMRRELNAFRDEMLSTRRKPFPDLHSQYDRVLLITAALTGGSRLETHVTQIRALQQQSFPRQLEMAEETRRVAARASLRARMEQEERRKEQEQGR